MSKDGKMSKIVSSEIVPGEYLENINAPIDSFFGNKIKWTKIILENIKFCVDSNIKTVAATFGSVTLGCLFISPFPLKVLFYAMFCTHFI